MTKLTTERLDKLQDNLLQFQDAYSDPADKENYDIFVDALHVLNELKAFRNAANNPVAWLRKEDRNHASDTTHDFDVANEWGARGLHVIDLYASPVLPKQPDVTLTDEGETAKIVKAAEKLVRCKGRYHSEQNYRALAALFGVTVPDLPPLPSDEAQAQPVIPEQALNTAKLINKFYERYPLETFAKETERAEALGYFMAGAELQCFGDFIAYDDHALQESE